MRINNSAIDWDSENVEIFPIGLKHYQFEYIF